MLKITRIHFYALVLFLIYSQGSNAQTLDINVIGTPVVGQPITIQVTATHPNGINRIRLVKDKDYENILQMFCSGSNTCTLQTVMTLDFIGDIILDAELWRLPNNYAMGTSVIVSFECQAEYCDPDPEVHEFFNWMREVGYDECVIERYYTYFLVPELRARMKEIARKRRIGYNQTDTVIFYDIIPTDAQATYVGMDIGEAPNCVYSALSPQFCPTPTSADYTFVENHWKTVFGIDFTFQYERIELNYVDTFGPPTWNSALGRWQFFIPNTFYIDNLENDNIAHFGIETWNGQPVREINGGSFCAQLFIEPTTLYNFGIYTHEWGHAQGLPHTFVDIDGIRTFLTPDGIMSNSYTPNTNLFDPLDPLERYVFEPIDNYVDQNTFAGTYSTAIVATNQFNNVCENIDPAVTAFTLDSTTDTHYIFKATLDNFGTIDASFVEVSFYEGSLANPPLIERTYQALEPNTPLEVFFTVDMNLIMSNDVFIKVDPANLITDEDETNNILSTQILLSIADFGFSNIQFKVYPNPVAHLLYIEASTAITYQTRLFTLDGKLLTSQKTNAAIDVSTLANGVYILEISDATLSHSQYKRIIVKR
jgi:hypothetical protein